MADRPRHSEDLFVGRVIDGRYRVDAPIGLGAVATVYDAFDLRDNRPVALKRWREQNLDEQVRGRFLREAKALETLNHPNIVRVFGHGVLDGVPYVVMEQLKGRTLDRLLVGGKALAPELALDIGKQMLAALAHAHRRDLVHRDLKPENVFIVDTEVGPQVKILDYGLAKFMSPEADPTKDVALTITGMMMGTMLYMPPEQAAGSSVDLPADVYAAGCVLFEMLTGRPPYVRETQMELVGAHMRAPIPKLEETLPGMAVAPELQSLIDQAMAKKQTDRFANAGQMLQALEALPRTTMHPGPLSLTTEAPPQTRGPSWWYWVVAGVLAVALGAGAAVLLR